MQEWPPTVGRLTSSGVSLWKLPRSELRNQLATCDQKPSYSSLDDLYLHQTRVPAADIPRAPARLQARPKGLAKKLYSFARS